MPNDLDIPMPHMTPAEASYRARRPRARMDSDTRRLALLAGCIAALLLLVVGIWAVAGRHQGGAVPVVQADPTPWRTKPEAQPAQADGSDDTAAGAIDALAPPPEVPAPQTLRSEADKLNASATPAGAPATTTAAVSAPVAAAAPEPVTPAPALPAVVSHSPVAPPPAVAAGTSLVQLGSLDSEQLATAEWQRLQHKMPDLLGARQPAIARSEHDGKTFFSLRTGGFASIAAATAFCAQVRAKGGVCTLAHA